MNTIFSKGLIFLLFLGMHVSMFCQGSQGRNTSNKFRELTTKDGLSNNWVSAIHQDKLGFIWIGTQYGLNKYDGYNTTYYSHDPSDTNSLGGNWVNCISEDKAGKLWLGTQDHGISVFDPRKEKFTRINRKKNGIPRDSPECIFIDEYGRKWVGFQGGGLSLLLPGEFKFQSFLLPGGADANHIKSIASTGNDQLWLGTMAGLFLFEIAEKKFTHFSGTMRYRISSLQDDLNDLLWVGTMERGLRVFDTKRRIYLEGKFIPKAFDSLAINDIERDGNDVLWLGTNSGLIYFPKEMMDWRLYNSDHLNTGDQVWSIQKGKSGNLWVGTSKGIAFNSANEFRYEQDHYGLYQTEVNELNTIRAILQTKDSVIWLGTNEGLFRYNPKAVTPELENIVAEVQIFCLLESEGGQIYAGALSGKGVYVIDPLNSSVVEIIGRNSPGGFSQYESVYALAKGPNGGIWIGTQDLYRYDVKMKEFIRLTGEDRYTEGIGRGLILSLVFDKNNNLFLGQSGGGLSVLAHSQLEKEEDLEFENFQYNSADTQSISNNSITDMHLDSKDQLWIGTDAGLNLFHPETRTFDRYLRKDGLRDDKIMGIAEGMDGNIWFSTVGHGLVELDQEGEQFYHHHIGSGMGTNSFLLKSVFRNQDGFIWFGNDEGLTGFHPDSILREVEELPPVVTSILVNGKELRRRDENDLLKTHANYLKEIELAPNQNSLTFRFSLLNYQLPELNEYEVFMNGVTSGWQSIGNRNEVTFINVPPGNYLLEIRGGRIGMGSLKSSCSMRIEIRPYWYKTAWAKALYILLGLGFVFFLYRLQLKRGIEKREIIRLKEIDEMKGRFYENIVHEFRTPLTLISGPVDQVMEKVDGLAPSEIRKKLLLVKSNSYHLLSMVNQMTDLSKLESGLLRIEPIKADVVGFLLNTAKNFQSLADSKDIDFCIGSEETKLVTSFDPQKLVYIVSNLLSNSFKFTPTGGRIDFQVEVSGSYLSFVVEDNGIGIPKPELAMIFDRYFQGSSNRFREHRGSGIGLAFTAELIDFLKGKISVESQPGKGSKFHVELPFWVGEGGNLETDNVELNIHFPAAGEQFQDEKPLILIVEDNWEMAEFIASCLEGEYHLQFALDGDSGTLIALECVPDIIISDVMMPIRDGIEMCEILKTSRVSSHIPIILLTAKVAFESRLRGLDKGADVYLEKPFHQAELQLRIRNLLQSRDRLRAWFKNLDSRGEGLGSGSDVYEIESLFLREVAGITRDSIQKGKALDVPGLCLQMGVSRSQLHRKITALTGNSATHFMNAVRISSAQDLLKENESTIAEIAYQTGFNDPSYFSKTFLKHTGLSPSKYREQF